jgi:membrane protein DedA with SNARE-associated domain
MLLVLLTLAVSTLVSEDLACVAAGTLIARGHLSPIAGIVACAAGIFAGDLGLWALGRFGGDLARRWPWLAARLPNARRWTTGSWLDRHAATVIITSRFTPGARLPAYLTAGLVRISPLRFGFWTAIAVAMWTPVVVLASAQAGLATGQLATAGPGWPLVAAAASAFTFTRVAPLLVSPAQRLALRIRIARLVRWEFWPAWFFYAPVALWVLLLALRHRGITTVTASNPGIPDGGVVGESKFDILQKLPAEFVIPGERLVAGEGQDLFDEATACMSRRGWRFPVVLKPDVGQRGAGVRLIRTGAQLKSYLLTAASAVLMQPFHEGPYEAGIFYYRCPGEAKGQILSITDKHFPIVEGDGRSTLRELINRHPRYRLQASLFLARHAHRLEEIPAVGEQVRLAIAGNHAQGTIFRDGGHLLTSELEARVDDIARRTPGFFIGRFDVRYRDTAAFMAGRDLAIVELNGATAESTNIYDPRRSLLGAYRVLFRQWSLVYRIGIANRARGVVPTPTRRLVRLVWNHLTTPLADSISD